MSVDARLAILEVGLEGVVAQIENDRKQRDIEHRENQILLRSIGADVKEIGSQVTDVTKRLDGTEDDVANIQEWRRGLASEIRGALKIPKLILTLMPVAMLVIAALGFLAAHPIP